MCQPPTPMALTMAAEAELMAQDLDTVLQVVPKAQRSRWRGEAEVIHGD